MDKNDNFNRLVELMATLRGPGGCPWDKEQTMESLTPYIIEEAYEVVEAIEDSLGVSTTAVKDELGDLLFQVIFLSRLAEEEGSFDISNVIDGIIEKMTRRHPHVFDDNTVKDSDEVLKNWDIIKKAEDGKKSNKNGLLDSIPKTLPALLRAGKVSKKAAKTGFDWKEVGQVMDKVFEEIEEFKVSLRENDQSAIEEEMGDILFALVNVSRFIKVDPERALRKTIKKFIDRFHYIERTITNDKRTLDETSIEEMEELWTEAKKKERDKK